MGNIEQLKQLLTATWDGNLICKSHRDELVKSGFAFRTNYGFNCISQKGVETLYELGVLKS